MKRMEKEEFVCSSLVCQERPGFSVPPNRASNIIAWMEDLEDTNGKDHPCFFFFVLAFHHRKGGKSSCRIEKTPRFSLSILLIYIFIMWSWLSVKKIQVDEVADPKSLS
jgi:hypothetical protein